MYDCRAIQELRKLLPKLRAGCKRLAKKKFVLGVEMGGVMGDQTASPLDNDVLRPNQINVVVGLLSRF